MEHLNQNSASNMIIDTEPNLLLRMESSENEEDIENGLETKIINREIKARKTSVYEELLLFIKDEDYDLIKFNMLFTSENCKYAWVVYHTPKEVRKHIKTIIQNISNHEIQLITKINISPKILEICHKNFHNDKDIINNLPLITEFYLQLFDDKNMQHNAFLLNFFCIGGNSFLKHNDGNKPFEGWAEKKVDKSCLRKCFKIFCGFWELCCMKKYNKRWIVLNVDHLFYMNDPMMKEGKIVYFFDKDMKIEREGKRCLLINNASMKLKLKFDSFFERERWKQELDKRKTNIELLTRYNRYEAYTPAKRYNLCEWFIDGKSYFNDLYQKLMEAQKSIYITDWWMSPEVFLKRPVDENIYIDMAKKEIISKDLGKNMSRLMDILDYKAKKGVKVYILIYYEVSIAVSLNSEHTKSTFEKLNKNIKFTRHPTGAGTLLWSHHEKLVIIDNLIGYVGGLDLCWGRYDFPSHPIYEPPNPQGIYEFPLIDYSNARICDFSEVQNYTKESVPRKNSVRMPWHDVHSRIIGPVVVDILRHFIERWNHANFDDRRERGLTFVNQGASFSQNKFNFWQKFSEYIRKKKVAIEQKKSTEIENSLKKLETKQTIILEEKEKGDNIIQDKQTTEIQINRSLKSGNLNEKKTEVSKKSGFYEKLVKQAAESGNKAMQINLEEEIANDDLYKKYFTPGAITSSVQVLRSSSKWSAGLQKIENSILKAYYDLIENAKHYIYIENQFFISKSWTSEEARNESPLSNLVKNEIALYLRKRIEKAYINKENFKVFVFLPLLPGFDGEPEKSLTIQTILKHTYASICRNNGLSIIEQLNKMMGDKWKNYIGFYSLRNHALVNNVPKTEILYIHSKLMIIDDTKVLIGSANINDRSMLGDRDSEFAVLIKENKALINKKNGKNFIMNGKMYRGAHFATLFRKGLMAEHLGLNENDPILDDPVDDKLFSLITSRANNNTQLYRSIFSCYPDDIFSSYEIMNQTKKLRERGSPDIFLQNYLKNKDNIIGHIVEFPLLFLNQEELGDIHFTKENLVPEYNFT